MVVKYVPLIVIIYISMLHGRNIFLKLISLSSYSYLTIELSFETIGLIWQIPSKRKDS